MRLFGFEVPPIDTFIGLWSPGPCIALAVFSAITLLIGEYAAEQIHHTVDPHDFRLDDPIHSRLIHGALFSLDLPTHWVWYEGAAIRDVLRAYRGSLLNFLLLIIFHAAFASPVVGFAVLTWSMALAVRAFSFDQVFWRRWFTPVLCLVTCVADIAEDMSLLRLAVSFPKFDQVGAQFTAWCSFVKFAGWFVLSLWWGVMILRIARGGGGHRASD